MFAGLDFLGANHNNFELYDITSGAVRIYVDSTGEVHIPGSMAVENNLLVNGTTTIVNTEITTTDKFEVDQTANQEAMIINKSATGIGTAVRITNNGTSPAITTFGTSPHVGIGTENPQNTLHVQTSATDGGVAVYDNASGLEVGRLFRNAATSAGHLMLKSAGSVKVDINANSISYFNGGLVGIGTANPQAVLHIYQTSGTSDIRVENTSLDSQSNITLKNDAQTWIVKVDGAQADNFVIRNVTGASDRVTITPAGLVGIGTTNPTDFLHTFVSSGNVVSTVQSAGADSLAAVKLSNDAQAWLVKVDGSQSDNFVIRNVTNAADRVTLTTIGYVGIGSTTPSYPLTIMSDTAAQETLQSTSTGRAYLRIQPGNGTNTLFVGTESNSAGATLNGTSAYSGFVSTTAAYPLHMGTSGTVRMTLTSGGYVGIGTTNPQSTIHLSNPTDGPVITFDRAQALVDGNSLGSLFVAGRDNGGVYRSVPAIGASSTGTWVPGTYHHDLKFYTSNSQRMTIDENGYVGIGSTQPQTPLDVVGQITGNLGFFNTTGASNTKHFRVVVPLHIDDGNAYERMKITVWGGAWTSYSGYDVYCFRARNGKTCFMESHNGGAGGSLSSVGAGGTYNLSVYTDVSGNYWFDIFVTADYRAIGVKAEILAHTSLSVPSAYSWRLLQVAEMAPDGSWVDDTANWTKTYSLITNDAGYVGIGTVPGSQLDMLAPAADVDTYIGLSQNNYTGDLTGTCNIEFGFRKGTGTLRSAGKITAGKDDTYADNAQSDSNMQFHTTLNGTLYERMRISSGGFIGIGTTVMPTGSALTIAGNDFNIAMQGTSGTESWILASNGPAANVFGIYQGSTSIYRMIIDSNGNVGIGTTNPYISAGTYNNFTLYSPVSTGTSPGPIFNSFRNSAIDNAHIYRQYFYAKDTAANVQSYGDINVQITNPTSGSEAAEFTISGINAGGSYTILQGTNGYTTIPQAGFIGCASHKGYNIGSATFAFDNMYADDFVNVADFYWLDERKGKDGNLVEVDDLAVIESIKPSDQFEKSTGMRIIDDNTLPEWMLHKASVTDAGFKEGDILKDPDGKPYLSARMVSSLLMGCVRQLNKKIKEQGERIASLETKPA
jgi:hypothetical protein